MDGHMRHGMVGTDVQGRGLYLYGAARDHSSSGTQLIAPENLHLPDTFSRQQANADVISMLEKVDWNIPRQALTQPRPCAERRAVA